MEVKPLHFPVNLSWHTGLCSGIRNTFITRINLNTLSRVVRVFTSTTLTRKKDRQRLSVVVEHKVFPDQLVYDQVVMRRLRFRDRLGRQICHYAHVR